MDKVSELTLRVLLNIRNIEKRKQTALSVVWAVPAEDRSEFLRLALAETGD